MHQSLMKKTFETLAGMTASTLPTPRFSLRMAEWTNCYHQLKQWNWKNRLTKVFGVIGFIMALHPMPMLAATVNVGDYSTLTNAITSAADGNTIILTNNITVSAEVAISGKGLTIVGNNYSISVPVPGLDASGITNASPSAFRVFNISASGKTNTLQNMTVKGGAPGSAGGGIWNNGGILERIK